MATMPRGATLIENAVSAAPGFTIGNVHVMAGVPRVMQAMMDVLVPTLKGGPPIASRAAHVLGLPEGVIAEGLGQIQARFPAVDIGSYPFYRAERQRRGDRRQRPGRGGGRGRHRGSY